MLFHTFRSFHLIGQVNHKTWGMTCLGLLVYHIDSHEFTGNCLGVPCLPKWVSWHDRCHVWGSLSITLSNMKLQMTFQGPYVYHSESHEMMWVTWNYRWNVRGSMSPKVGHITWQMTCKGHFVCHSGSHDKTDMMSWAPWLPQCVGWYDRGLISSFIWPG